MTDVPTGPVASERERLRVTVNVTVSQKPSESTASMLQALTDMDGTLRKQKKLPKGSVVTDGGFVATRDPSKKRVTIAFAAKPTPVIVRTVIIGPLEGETETSGTTLKVAFAEAPTTSIADSILTPAGVGGRVNT